jgi:DNA ligase-associated metallophosphoesterase
MRLELNGEILELDPSGLLVWPRRGLVAVADLHMEKGSAFARRGRFLPPYDTHATLSRLEDALERLRPAVVVSLGDGFHDRRGPERLEPDLAERLRRLTTGVDWVWVRGNHDPEPPVDLGGRPVPELRLDGLVLRHEPTAGGRGGGEVAGHRHPQARVAARRLGVVRRPCFASDGGRLLLPAFGSFTGGLDVLDPAIAGLFPAGFAAYLLGEERVFRLPHDRLLPDPRSAALAR